MSGLSVAIVGTDGEYGAVVVSAANRALCSDRFVFPEDASVLVMQNEVPEAANRAVAAEARNNGATVVLNAAPMRPMSPELMRLVDLLVVNRIEAEGLFSAPIRSADDALKAADRAAAGIAGEMIVTPGERRPRPSRPPWGGCDTMQPARYRSFPRTAPATCSWARFVPAWPRPRRWKTPSPTPRPPPPASCRPLSGTVEFRSQVGGELLDVHSRS